MQRLRRQRAAIDERVQAPAKGDVGVVVVGGSRGVTAFATIRGRPAVVAPPATFDVHQERNPSPLLSPGTLSAVQNGNFAGSPRGIGFPGGNVFMAPSKVYSSSIPQDIPIDRGTRY